MNAQLSSVEPTAAPSANLQRAPDVTDPYADTWGNFKGIGHALCEVDRALAGAAEVAKIFHREFLARCDWENADVGEVAYTAMTQGQESALHQALRVLIEHAETSLDRIRMAAGKAEREQT